MCYNAPDLTPPGQTASAQVGQNVNTAIANSFLNNVNQIGPNGTMTNSVTDYYKLVDKSDPDNIQRYKVPIWTQTEQLTPQQQAIKDQQDQTKLGMSTLANDQTAFLQDYMKQPFNYGKFQNTQGDFNGGPAFKNDQGDFKYNAGQHEQWAGGLYDDLNGDREQQQQQGLQSQLANSGIKLGSDAYNTAMQSQGKATEDARNQFMLDSYNTGFGNSLNAYNTNFNTDLQAHNTNFDDRLDSYKTNFGTDLDQYKTNFTTAQANRNQPINEITALMSGGQVGTNQFGPTNNYTIPTVDQAGIIANYDAQKQQQAMAQYNAMSGIMGGLFSGGAALLSDERAKTDIDRIGEMDIIGDDGDEHETGLFSYRYKGQPKSTPKSKGVMAQNVARVKPSAVSKTPEGLFAVHYDRLKKRA